MGKIFITGAAGFIGSNLVDRLLDLGMEIVGWDNFSTGRRAFLDGALKHGNFALVEGDTLDPTALSKAMSGCDTVFHLCANADVRFGTSHPRRDLEQNTIATHNVLEAMRVNGIGKIAFASTGSVYGETDMIPTPEHAPFPVQTSLYGASKLACEGLIQAYGEGFGIEGHIFRFVSILGERYTHGHIVDFYRQLREHPDYLRVLGDGTQRKSYLEVGDCIEAMLHVTGRSEGVGPGKRIAVYNLGTEECVTVNESIGIICRELGLTPRIEYSGGGKGWIGDNPLIFLDTKKIRSTGWKSAKTISDGIVETIRWLQGNPWILDPSVQGSEA